MLKCHKCGNTKKFRAWQRCRGTMRILVDGNEEWIEDVHNEKMSYDPANGPFTCCTCGIEVESAEE